MQPSLHERLTRLALMIWRLPLPGWLRAALMLAANPRFVVTASAVVINEAGEVLLFRHTYRQMFAWGLPGGFLKDREDPAAAVEREIREESGLEVRVLRPLWTGRDPFFPCINLVYTAALRSAAFRPSQEVSEARFFSPEALPPLSPQTCALIRLALAGEGGMGR